MAKQVAVDTFYEIRRITENEKQLESHNLAAQRYQGSEEFNHLCQCFSTPVSVKYKFDLSKKVNELTVRPEMTVYGFMRSIEFRWFCKVERVEQSTASGYKTVPTSRKVGDLGDKPLVLYVSEFRVPRVTINGVYKGMLSVHPNDCMEAVIRNDRYCGRLVGDQFCVVDCRTHRLLNLRKSVKQVSAETPDGVLKHRLNVVTREPIKQWLKEVDVYIGTIPKPVVVQLDVNNPIPVDEFLARVAAESPVSWIERDGIVVSGSREVTGRSFVYDSRGKLVVKDRNEVRVSVEYCGTSCNGPLIQLSLKRTDTVAMVKELYLGNTKRDLFDKSSVFVFDRDSNQRFDDTKTIGDVAGESNGKLLIQGEMDVFIHVVGYTPDDDELDEIEDSYPVTNVLREIAAQYRQKYPQLGGELEIACQRRCKRSGKTVDCGRNSLLRDVPFEDYDTLVIIFKNPAPLPTTTATSFAMINLRAFELEMRDWKMVRRLGKGSFGVVEEYEQPDHVHVAVKRVHQSDFNESELRLMLALRGNPAVITTYGTVNIDDDVGIVMEVLPASLDAVIRTPTRDSKLTPTEEYIVLLGIAYGMRYCHAKQVVHRDLKPANILLDDNHEPRITDFGEAVRTKARDTMLESMRGTPYYMAPEVMNEQPYDGKADVFSFACILYEMLTGRHLSNATGFRYFATISRGVRPEIPDEIASKPLGALLDSCWHNDPSQRPTFEEIFECLRQEQYFFDWCEDFDKEAVTDYISGLDDF